jgi:hypothetical protein
MPNSKEKCEFKRIERLGGWLTLSYVMLVISAPSAAILSVVFANEGGIGMGISAAAAFVIFAASFVTMLVSKRALNRYDKDFKEAVENSPLLTAKARVFGKTTETSGGGTVYDGSNYSLVSVETEHYVSFEFGNRRENAAVDVSLYNTVAEGDSGVLEYKDVDGEFHFVDFVRGNYQ